MKTDFFNDSGHCKKRLSLLLIALCLLLPLVAREPSDQSIKEDPINYFELIMERIQARNKAVNVSTVDNTYTKWYMQQLLENGSFSNIDYTSTAQTNWGPLAHLDRLKYMVLSYTTTGSNFYQNEDLYNQIVLMLNFWYDKDPRSTNWFNQQIACPQRMGVILILMRSGAKQIPAELEAKLIQRMVDIGGRPDQSGSQGTGANKLDIATHWVYRGCLTEDQSVLSFGADQVYYPLFLTTDEGLQHDYSYHQHGNQIHMGSYGYSFVEGISSIADYMTDTPYAMSPEKLNYLSSFTREGYVATIRGQYFMYNVIGRAVARKGALSQSGFGTVLNRLKTMDPSNATEYDQSTDRLKANQPASYAINPTNKNFWRSDYILHQRPGYFLDVRGASTYSSRSENGNGENLKAYFLADGASEIVLDGTEYVNIFGVWDWNRIPGTTLPMVSKIPQPAQWSTPGTSKFSGSASDGVYGVTTYLYNDTNTSYALNTTAKKSWFMFDNEVVCLGAGITSSTQTVNTTVNQTLLSGDVSLKRSGAATQQQAKSTASYNDLTWVHHRNIGYYFPQGGNINVANIAQTGNWYDINTTQTNETVSADVFKLWFDHGATPTNTSYEYILLPNKTLAEMETYTPSDIEIIYNNSNLQAVRHKTLDILSIVFYSATTFSKDDIEITVDKPCVVLFRNISTSSVDTYISDPSRNNSDIKITAKLPAFSEKKELKCKLTKLKDAYAGSTVSYLIDQTTPDATAEVKYEARIALEDAWVRDGSDADKNVGGTTNTLTVKNDNAGYNREAYLKFDISNIDTTVYVNYALKLRVSHSNTSIADINWIINHTDNNSTWSENTITWNTAPAIDYEIVTAPTITAGSDFIVDITDAVLKEIRKGSKTLSLNIKGSSRGTDGKTDAQFYSKECGTPEYFPELRLLEGTPVPAPDIVEIITNADAFVRDGATYENDNYGSGVTITVKEDGLGYAREGYLKFNLESLKGRRIRNVALKLYVNNANTSVDQTYWAVNGTDTNWDETSVTYATRPSDASDILDSMRGTAAGSFVTFNISDYVEEQFKAGAKELSFHIYGLEKATDGKHDVQFASKENGTVANRPRIVIELEPDAVITTAEPITTANTTVAQGSEFTVSGSLKNNGKSAFQGDLGLALINSNNQILDIIGLFGENISLAAESGWAAPINVKCTISDTIPNGKYKIKCVSKPTDVKDWSFINTESQGFDEIEITVNNAPAETTWSPLQFSPNWFDPANWTNGIPGETTKVTIAKSDSYPVLFDSVKVDIIYFEPGVELKGQNMLTYNKAFVDYDFDAGQRSKHSRTRSIPLKEAYPADFTFGSQPATYFQTLKFDEQTQKAKFVTASNGSIGKIKPGAGFMLSVYPDKDADKGLALTGRILRIPYFDADANVASAVHPNHEFNSTTNISTFYNPTRTQSYDVERSAEAYTLADSKIEYKPEFISIGESSFALVGNPFMASLQFWSFADTNRAIIKNNYQVWTKEGNVEGYAGYDTELGSFGIELDSELTNNIAPLQGFFVELAAQSDAPLIFDLSSMVDYEMLGVLRNTNKTSEVVNKIKIVARNQNATVSTLLAKRDNGSLLFGNSDTRKLINEVGTAPEVYTIKSTEKGAVLTSVNVTSADNVEYPIGIATTQSGQTSLTFSGMDSYDGNISFTDKVLGQTINLTGLGSYEYYFDYAPKTNGNEVVPTNDRFSLRMTSATSSINDPSDFDNNQSLVVYADKGFIHATNSNGAAIKEISVYNISGVLVYQASVNTSSHTTNQYFQNGVYIVKVKTDSGIDHKKVIVK